MVTLIATAVLAMGGADTTPLSCDGKPMVFHRHRARAILRSAYRDEPSRNEIRSYQAHKRCIGDQRVREALAALRSRLRGEMEERRFREKYTPYPGPGNSWWALPYSIVYCESGADYHVGFAGAYGLLVATWQQWGGVELSGASTAGSAAPRHQDIVAHRVWTDVGPVGWECA